ncbi:BrnT family toxin [Coraliomargarita algicola]
MLNRKLWVAFYTPRGDKTRIISVRRARTNERKLYES